MTEADITQTTGGSRTHPFLRDYPYDACVSNSPARAALRGRKAAGDQARDERQHHQQHRQERGVRCRHTRSRERTFRARWSRSTHPTLPGAPSTTPAATSPARTTRPRAGAAARRCAPRRAAPRVGLARLQSGYQVARLPPVLHGQAGILILSPILQSVIARLQPD